jgi:transposase
MLSDLYRLRDLLLTQCITHVAMESTSVFWKPIYNVLEGSLQMVLVNAQHVKNVPGRKTDISDAEWLADLLQHGLLRPSFVPDATQRELRDLTRYRSSLVQDRARTILRLQKILEDANIKLSSVVKDLTGVSATDILHHLLAGTTDPATLAELARGKLRSKRDLLQEALAGRLKAHHRFLITEQLALIDSLDESIAHLSQEIAERLRPFEPLIAHLMTIPGIGRRLAEILLAEIGTDVQRFPSARHLASWAGMCPGNRESAGKRLPTGTRHGNPWLRSALTEAAHAASHTKQSYLATFYQRLAVRRGSHKAIMALGHTLIVILFHIINKQEDYHELGSTFFDERDRSQVQRRLVHRLQALGYEVTLQFPEAPPLDADA